MKPSIRLLYLTYHENILGSGILYTQVIRMLERMGETGGVESITLLSFMSPQLLLRERKGFARLKERLRGSGITLIALPMLILTTWSWVLQLAMLLWTIPVLIVAVSKRCNIIHPRGYGAGILALTVSKLLGVPYVFDPRGLYPEERVINGVWSDRGITFRLYKYLETTLIRDASATIGVTTGLRDDFRVRNAKMACFIPNRADIEAWTKAAEVYRMSAQYDPKAAKCILLFTGELFSRWYDPAVLVRHYRAVKCHCPDVKLSMFTQLKAEKVYVSLIKLGVSKDEFSCRSGRPAEMPELIQGATLGLIITNEQRSGWPAKFAESIWPVKFAEYLAAGIPVLMDENLLGLPPKLVKRHRLGLVVNPNRVEDYRQVGEILSDWEAWSDRCIAYAKRRLDIKTTAKQHLRIYRQIIAKK